MATLADILALILPGTSLPGPLDVHVGWVRVLRARVPALDVLEPGDLVVVPAASIEVVAPTPDAVGVLAQTLARSGASGLLLVPPTATHPAFASDGPTRDALAELAAAAADVGLPAVRIDGIDTAALERRLIGYLVDRRGELEREAAGFEGDLAKLAMAGRGVDALAAAIGGYLGRAVALEGRRFDALALYAPIDAPDAAAAASAYLALPRATGRRVPLPGAPGEQGPAGWLVLLGVRPPDEREAIAIERIAPLLSLQLVLEAQVRRARDEGGRGEALPSGGPPWAVLVARQPVPGPGESTREEMRRELRLRFADRQLALRGTSESLELRGIAALDAGDPTGVALAARVAGLLGRPVGLSAPFTAASERPVREADARTALEAVEALPVSPLVARADRVPAYRILAGLGNLPDGRRHAAGLLAPLLAARPSVVRERLATLRAVLDHVGAGDAAAALGVHRNTLAYRVRDLESRTGWSLHDPELRLALAIAVRLVQSAQHLSETDAATMAQDAPSPARLHR